LASKSRARRGRNFILIAALATAGGTLAGGSLASGATSGGGGVTAPKPPKLTGVSCIDRCAGLREAAPEATVELAGKRLRYVEKVRFPAEDGGVSVKPTDVAGKSVEAEVPKNAENGRPRAIDEFGQVAKSPDRLRIVDESDLPEPGSFRLADATVNPAKAFFYGTGKPTLTYMFNGNGPTDVRVDLVRIKDGTTVRSWVLEDVAPNSEQTLPWNGEDDAGKAARRGEYEFRIGGVGERLRDTNGTSFGLYDHKFPIRGRHTYGDGVGAPRSGHSHQGQDVFAKCGVPLEAARGGKVQFKGYHSAAGNYLVIDGKKTNLDYVYMHLRNKAEVREGESVKTGERIGEVGETGNASGCHLHFELWSKPGWYEGGDFMPSVTRKLKKWDKWS
jgi:murein DD-endopeptidase MepM/ murein hydrolase activator NlpD